MINDDIDDVTSTMQRMEHIELDEHNIDSDEDIHRKRVYELHRLIRHNDGDWDSVREQANSTSTIQTEYPLMISSSGEGWNVVHLTALQGPPSLKWWKWMLLRVLEDHHQYSPRQLNQNEKGEKVEVKEKVEYWNGGDGSSPSPFFQRTQEDYAPTDLFFAKKVHPPPWYQLHIRDDAEKLRDNIDFLLSHSDEDGDCPNGSDCTVTDCKECEMDRINNDQNSDILEELRRRIEYKFEMERLRQRTVGGESQSLLLEQSTLVEEYIEGGQDYDMTAMLDHVRNETPDQVEFMKKKYEDMLRIKELMEEFANEITVFWHELELFLMASTYNTMHIDAVSDDTDLTGATREIYKVNPPTAPFHKRYPTRRSVVVPPPSSSDNDQTNNNKEEQQQQQNDVVQTRRQWNVVHALAHTGCPAKIAQLAVILYPEQVTTRDHNGNLPLHLAAASHHYHITNLQESGIDTDTDIDDDLSDKITSPISPILDILLQTYPEGAKIPDAKGRLPINLALSAGKDWESGIRHIFMACPLVVLCGSRDITTRLHPFMLAAVDHSDGGGGDVGRTKVDMETKNDLECMKLTTIYELLTIMPDAVRSGI